MIYDVEEAYLYILHMALISPEWVEDAYNCCTAICVGHHACVLTHVADVVDLN